MGLALAEDAEETVNEYLSLLATHFKVDDDEVLLNLFDHCDFVGDVDLPTLFDIASRFNDGHGLKAIKMEGCWSCSSMRLFEFGGDGTYLSRNVTMTSTSSQSLALGLALDVAIEQGDLDEGAKSILSDINSTLAGIYNDDSRDSLREKIGRLLLASTNVPDSSVAVVA